MKVLDLNRIGFTFSDLTLLISKPGSSAYSCMNYLMLLIYRMHL